MTHKSNTSLRALLDDLSGIYEFRANGRYGLTQLSQLMHAVQAGALCKSTGAPATLVVAALLHDIGHMIHQLGDHPAAAGLDDRHEFIGANWLARNFGPAVSEPVRLHVAAKRYLCTTEPGYQAILSRDSVESLALQGGLMTQAEVMKFKAEPYWKDALSLRRIDDAAKDPDGPSPQFSSFLDVIEAAFRRNLNT
jgi:predicted HD phosphohydrolase